MKLTGIFAVAGLIISVSWVTRGFLPMLAILLTTLFLAAIGYALDILGRSTTLHANYWTSAVTNRATRRNYHA